MFLSELDDLLGEVVIMNHKRLVIGSPLEAIAGRTFVVFTPENLRPFMFEERCL